ncbi:DEAD/DEAH box helicase [Roseateles koreensis]|uniref:DEAD/DEAH box helicase n=1 Tax=Roseateles koreensis TaxID=2987526 RepID=A0ABT5KQN8_9BURK|nr:DEAD/DEAH box helicase [Roseateles koreensis]MDC8785222.1 DEAD/DEAH box helicase [Roseateles koreensis]
MSFATLGLSPALLRAVRVQGYHAPTAIQTEAIPAILDGHDVLGLAQTGSGKTAAYALPLLQHVYRHRLQSREQGQAGPRLPLVVVVVPTRELAVQVGETFEGLVQILRETGDAPMSLKVTLAFGGVSINPQLMALRGGSDIVVATPGRLLDLLAHRGLSLADVGCLVLDEADRLLDLGFSEEMQRVLEALPEHRQNLFFSATFAKPVEALAQALLQAPVRIEITPEPQRIAAIHQRAIVVDEARRTPLLRQLLTQEGWTRVLVFVATKYATEHVSEKLWKTGVKAAALHGELSQGGRQRVLNALKSGEIQVLVATDVAARGLDIPELPVVLNYDLPRSATDYTHRIGRTGRAGEAGLAVSFISGMLSNGEAHFRLIEKRQGQRVPREQIEGFEASAVASAAASVGGVKGHRKSKKDKLREAAAKLESPAEAASGD